MNMLFLRISLTVTILAMVGCVTYPGPHGRPSSGVRLDADAFGVGVDASLGMHGTGGYAQQGMMQRNGAGRQQMMMRFFDPCDPGLQMSGRAWVQAPVNLAGRGQVNEQAQAYVGNGGKSCHWSGSSATSYGPMGQ